MAGNRLRLRALLAAVALAALLLGTAATEAYARTDWDGSLDLYRSGTYTVQKTWLWCTAADVQIIKNIVDRQRDHSTGSQRRYFEWMRARNRYDLPLSAGVDPVGWTAGLRHFVDSRYRLVSSASFDGALRSAVQRMRATELPVALAVDNGNHGWVLTGFSATKDPATSKDFKVTSVRVVGPLYGLHTRSFGYDMKPGKSLTTAQLRQFFTPWRYAPKRMIWDGRYVSIQPVPTSPPPQKAQAPLPVLPGKAAAAASPSPTPAPSIGASSPAPASPGAVAVVPATDAPRVSEPAGIAGRAVDEEPVVARMLPIGALAVLLIVVLAGITWMARGRPKRVVR